MTIEKSGSSLSLHKIDWKLSTDALLEKKYWKYFPRDFFTNQDQLSNLNSSNENNFSEPKIQSNGKIKMYKCINDVICWIILDK